MKKIVVIHINDGESTTAVEFLGQTMEIHRIGCHGDPDKAEALIKQFDGTVDVIGLEGMPHWLELGPARREHPVGARLTKIATQTPVVDGSGIRAGIERWGVILADRAQPGIFAGKRILMVPGLNHAGLSQSLSRRSDQMRFADPEIFFALPDVPGVGAKWMLEQAAAPTLEQLQDAPFRRLLPEAGQPGVERSKAPFEWADLLAGDIGTIRRYAPEDLKRKTIVVESATEEDVEDLKRRGASIVVTMIPALVEKGALSPWSASVFECCLVAARRHPDAPLNEDTYLDLMADLQWTPGVRYLQPEEMGLNKFAFVIHPLNIGFIHKHDRFRWTKYLPDEIVEPIAALIPPMYVGKITGGQSPATGQKIEGYLISLGTTPREMMSRDENFTYKKLVQSAKMAERFGARIMGLGAFTSVIGDAGITTAHQCDIAITSGNSLTVAATLEAAKQAVIKMGATDLTKGKAMVIGGTGSIGSVCARLIAQAIKDVVLVSIEPERLIEFKRMIEEETPGAQVTISTRAGDLVSDCDLIITATSAFGQRIVDITKCKPGAVICDVARPPDISEQEAALRPDVLVIESGEVIIPGDIHIGYDIGLPPKTVYACLAETSLLAMEGRFEDYTLGRNITMERVKEIYKLFKKHGYQLGGLRSHGKFVTEEEVAQKRVQADHWRAHPEEFKAMQKEAGAKLEKIPRMSKGVKTKQNSLKQWGPLMAGVGVIGGLMLAGRKKS
ncbi:serine carboxypeptidase [Candidatus Amarolinea aalborgensis]|uniref:serine carboxypeptidase n=1 Tax=Candidatus Amarolinea aalborgensis TaxID=2249329 RepID=UPI003BF9EC60